MTRSRGLMVPIAGAYDGMPILLDIRVMRETV